tara:strand:+ start:890 stop:1207 length:318 start_codon:yes stop_codon:yes gene_type:complete
MKKEIEEIRQALIELKAYDDEAREALESLEGSMDEIDQHPAMERLRQVIGETAVEVRKSPEGENAGGVSGKWQALKDHLGEWEDDHPKMVLSVGKMAEALAVVGL